MPRINRIRVTNIQYDNGKKHLPDLIFEARGFDTLLLLANGGGKSLLIQLLLQTVLPNTRMGKRKVEDLLKAGGYTGHVAVEWLLDSTGERQQFLCTGFCFSNGNNSDQPLRYYNYLFDYAERDQLTLETLPLIEDAQDGSKRPTKYQRLKDWLRDKNIQPIDRTEAYQERLRSYKILPEEWKNIRETNGSEGGVDKFFEKSRTTLQLMDNLLIPAVEEIIFQQEHKKKELFHAFAQHREMLLEIPVIKQNLKDFAAIRDYAEGVVDEVAKLDRVQQEFEVKTRELVGFAQSMHLFSQAAQAAVGELETEQAVSRAKYEEYDWQEQSYDWYVKQLELKEAQGLLAKLQEEQEVRRAEVQRSETEAKQLTALKYMTEAERAKQERRHVEEQLALLDQTEPELQALLAEAKTVLRTAWQTKREALQNQQASKVAQQQALQAERTSLGQAKAQAQEQLGQLQEGHAKVSVWLDNYQSTRQSLYQSLGEEVLTPGQAIVKRQQAIADCRQEQASLQAGKAQLLAEVERLRQREQELQIRQGTGTAELKNVEEQLAAFLQAEDKLRGQLSEQSLYTKGLLPEQETVLLRVKQQLAESQMRKLACQAELANLQEKWALVDGRDYYVPHHDLLRIKQRLDRAGLYAVLGSEWLAAQPLTEAEKEVLLAKQPLLPFALLVEASQVNAVKNVMRQGKDWTSDLPLLFLVKNAIEQAESQAETFIPLWQEQLYLFRPDSLRLYSSGDALQQLKQELRTKIEQKEQAVAAHAEVEHKWVALQAELRQFYQRYPEQLQQTWQEQQTQLRRHLTELAEQLMLVKAELEAAHGQLTQVDSATAEAVSAEQGHKETLVKLDAFNKLYQELPAQERQAQDLKEQLDQIKARLKHLEAQLEACVEATSKLNYELQHLEELAKAHQQDFELYQLEAVSGSVASEVSYEAALSQVEAVMEQLRTKQADRSNLEKLLSSYIERYHTAMELVAKTEVELVWLQQNRRSVSGAELTAAEAAVKAARGRWEEQKSQVEDAQRRADRTEAVVQEQSKAIVARWGREPYVGFTETGHGLEIDSLSCHKRDLQSKLEQLGKDIRRQLNWQRETQEAYELALEQLPEEIKLYGQEVTPFTEAQWQAFDTSPQKLWARWYKARSEKQTEIERQQAAVTNKFENYLRRLEATNNAKVYQFIRDVKLIMESKRLFDYAFVQDQFLRIFEGLERYEAQFQMTLVECEKNKSHLIDLCIRRAGAVYESIAELPKNSRINLYERELQVIKLDWPRREPEEALQRISMYFEQALVDLQTWKQQGKTDDEINRIMEEQLRTRNLLQQIAPLENCRVLVYKPRKESLIRYGKPEYALWDEVPKWSGGEEYSVYVTMFMILLTHIRQQSEGRLKVWKVLVADNPFGKASSPHVWEPVFQIAKSNQIQLLCLTAHKQDDILKRFPVVYSLQLRNAYGTEIMKAEAMESGFYRLDTATEAGAQLMLPV